MSQLDVNYLLLEPLSTIATIYPDHRQELDRNSTVVYIAAVELSPVSGCAERAKPDNIAAQNSRSECCCYGTAAVALTESSSHQFVSLSSSHLSVEAF